MGYIWDLVKHLGAFLVLFLLNLMFDEDFSQSRPFIYWGVWVVALIGVLFNPGVNAREKQEAAGLPLICSVCE